MLICAVFICSTALIPLIVMCDSSGNSFSFDILSSSNAILSYILRFLSHASLYLSYSVFVCARDLVSLLFSCGIALFVVFEVFNSHSCDL